MIKLISYSDKIISNMTNTIYNTGYTSRNRSNMQRQYAKITDLIKAPSQIYCGELKAHAQFPYLMTFRTHIIIFSVMKSIEV